MTEEKSVVYVVDDDPSVRKALPRAVRAVVDELREMGIAVKVKTRKRDRLKN